MRCPMGRWPSPKAVSCIEVSGMPGLHEKLWQLDWGSAQENADWRMDIKHSGGWCVLAWHFPISACSCKVLLQFSLSYLEGFRQTKVQGWWSWKSGSAVVEGLCMWLEYAVILDHLFNTGILSDTMTAETSRSIRAAGECTLLHSEKGDEQKA